MAEKRCSMGKLVFAFTRLFHFRFCFVLLLFLWSFPYCSRCSESTVVISEVA